MCQKHHDNVIWFEALESKNHISSMLDVLAELDAFIEFALCHDRSSLNLRRSW